MLVLAYFCHKYGVDRSFTEQEFKQRFQREDVPDTEIKAIINYCYSNTEGFGSKTYHKPKRPLLPDSAASPLPYSFINECYERNERGMLNYLLPYSKGKSFMTTP